MRFFMKKINELIDTNYDLDIFGITDDSRDVKEGFIFVATKGYNVDHFDYIDSAIKNGCCFLVVDRKIEIDFPHIIVDNIFSFYIELCKKFYDVDLDDFNFIGITGTDGKTTTTTIIQRLIDDCAYIGTNGIVVKDKLLATSNTTPCISELYRDLSIIKSNNIKNVVMEVSSEALLHDRLNGFKFDIIGFTNITGDHLNVHKTFKNYFDCKLKLLTLLKDDGYVFVNGDDLHLQSIKHKNMSSFGFNDNNDYKIISVNKKSNYVDINLSCKDENIILHSPLFGKYNVYNVVMAFIVCLQFGVNKDILMKKIKKLKPISGRCEFLNFGNDFDIVLDYAHTINGIDNILDAFNNGRYNRIITVSGAAGGREHEKRNVIGNILIDKSDIAVFTIDDPRYEKVDDIIDEMVGERKDYIRIVDREEAIKYALDIASRGDVVLILGKGRDNYMAIEDKKVPYNDYDVIKKYFSK